MSKNKDKKSIKQIIIDFFAKIWFKFVNVYRTSKVALIVEKIVRFLSGIFWPFGWIKERTFDKLRFDVQKKVVSLIFLLPVILGFLVFFAYPLLQSFIYSFSIVTPFQGGVNKEWIGFSNYIYAFRENATYPVNLLNTMKNTVADCAVITIFSLLLAVMLNGKFKCRGLVRAIFFLPVIFNSEAVTAAMQASSSMNNAMSAGGKDALTGLFDMSVFLIGIGIPKAFVSFLSGITTSIYNTITYSGIQILIFLTAIQSVPKHLYEAAKMEGATQYEMFWKITLPMVSPMIPTVIVYTVIDSYLRSDVTETIEYFAETSEYGIQAAMSWSYLGIVAVFLLLVLGILSKVVFYYDDKK